MNRVAEIPYWLPLAMIVLAACLWVMGNNRLDKTLKRMALGLLAIAAVVAMISFSLESDAEQVRRHTREIVNAVESRDWDKTKALLHPRIRVMAWSGPEQVTNAVQIASSRVELGDSRIAGLELEDTQGTYTTRVRVVGGNSVTNWDLEWARENDKWLLLDVRPLGGFGMTASQMEDFLRRRGS